MLGMGGAIAWVRWLRTGVTRRAAGAAQPTKDGSMKRSEITAWVVSSNGAAINTHHYPHMPGHALRKALEQGRAWKDGHPERRVVVEAHTYEGRDRGFVRHREHDITIGALSQHCEVFAEHDRCPGENTLGTSACSCECHDPKA